MSFISTGKSHVQTNSGKAKDINIKKIGIAGMMRTGRLMTVSGLLKFAYNETLIMHNSNTNEGVLGYIQMPNEYKMYVNAMILI